MIHLARLALRSLPSNPLQRAQDLARDYAIGHLSNIYSVPLLEKKAADVSASQSPFNDPGSVCQQFGIDEVDEATFEEDDLMVMTSFVPIKEEKKVSLQSPRRKPLVEKVVKQEAVVKTKEEKAPKNFLVGKEEDEEDKENVGQVSKASPKRKKKPKPLKRLFQRLTPNRRMLLLR